MFDRGESRKEVIRPDFNRGIIIDFQGAKITSDVGFLLVRWIDDRFGIIDPMKDCLEDLRSPTHTRHSLVQMVRQRVYQIAAGYEDCNDGDFLRIDPTLRLALIGRGAPEERNKLQAYTTSWYSDNIVIGKEEATSADCLL